MRQLDLGRTRIAGATTALAVVAALVVSMPVARADDATGTPTPPAASSGQGALLASTTDATTAGTTTADTTTAAPPTTTTPTTTPPKTTPATSTPPTTPPPVAVVSAASGVWKVKDLQVRLRLVRSTYWPYAVSGVYGWALGQQVLAFQRDQNLPASGVVDQVTWNRLVALTRTSTAVSARSSAWTIRDAQVRLRLVRSAYWPHALSTTYSAALGQKVLAFQRDRDLPQSGVLDQRTWSRLVSLTATPVAVSRSSSPATLRELQLRLRASGLWRFAISGTWSTTLAQRVLVYQRGRSLPQSGAVDARTWNHLVASTHRPGTWDQLRYQAGSRPLLPSASSLDARCRTGRVMCVDKATRTLTWVVDGKPLMAMWARFGRPGRETREGTFRVSRMYQYVISNLYFTPMPYSMFFSGGQAVHYSSNFARLGYASASHGCVNIADLAQVRSLYFKVRVGDKVVVHH